MPLPIAHTGIGLACYLSLPKRDIDQLNDRKNAVLLLLFAFLANLPDLDFLPGIIVGQPNAYHHGPSHSIVLALIAAVAVFSISYRYFHELGKVRYLLALLLVCASHTLLDFFSKDTGHPFGVPLLWPLHEDYFISSTSLFSDVERSSDPGFAFIMSLFNSHNLIAIAGESLFVIMVLSAAIAVRNRNVHKRRNYWSALSVISSVGLAIFLKLMI